MSPQYRLLGRLSLHREAHPAHYTPIHHTPIHRRPLLMTTLCLRGDSPWAIGTRLRAGLPYREMAASWSLNRLGPEQAT